MANQFVCSICGKEHAGLPTDWAFKLPDDVWAIREPERADTARFNNDLCQLGERYFIRCVLEMPFTDREGFFGWGAWAEVEWEVFQRYLELYEADGRNELPKEGSLANTLRAYDPDTKGHPILIQFREATRRPSLHVFPEDVSALALEQRKGIEEIRYHEILDAIGA